MVLNQQSYVLRRFCALVRGRPIAGLPGLAVLLIRVVYVDSESSLRSVRLPSVAETGVLALSATRNLMVPIT